MDETSPIEQPFASTTFEWKRVKMSRSAGGQVNSRPKGGLKYFRKLGQWDWRQPLTLKISYRGGAEAWFEIHTRGGLIRRPGTTQLVDLMTDICNQGRS